MNRYKERESLMVRLMDRERLEERVNMVLAAQYGDDAVDQRAKVPELAVVKNRKILLPWRHEDLVLIHTEGVMYWANSYGRIEVPAYLGSQMIEVEVGCRLLSELFSDEEVDLAEHVRRFGDRLESNYWGCYRMATQGREVNAA